MTEVPILMPWKDVGDRSRSVAHAWCKKYWSDHGFDTIIEGSGQSRSEMCNDAARKAVEMGADVLIFVDADTWTLPEQLRDAISLARSSDLLVHAFTDYVRIGSMTTQRSISIPHDRLKLSQLLKSGRSTPKHVSGASAVSVETWNALGGFDERFTTYGSEDRAFHLAAEAYGGYVERISGPAMHWYHHLDPHKSDRPRKDDPKVQLIARYCQAAGYVPDYGQLGRLGASGFITIDPDQPSDWEAMQAVLLEPGGPLSQTAAHDVT